MTHVVPDNWEPAGRHPAPRVKNRGPAGSEVKPLLDIHDVATRLNITVRHVRRLVAERRIPYLKVGKLVRFDPHEIKVWTASLAVVSTKSDAERTALLLVQPLVGGGMLQGRPTKPRR